jgi:hypothetical protein
MKRLFALALLAPSPIYATIGPIASGLSGAAVTPIEQAVNAALVASPGTYAVEEDSCFTSRL